MRTPGDEPVGIGLPDGGEGLTRHGFRSWVTIDWADSAVLTTAVSGTAELAPDAEVVAEGRWRRGTVQALRPTPPPAGIDATQVHADVTSFVYRGPHHEFQTTVAGQAELDRFEDFLRFFRIDDDETGIAVSPRRGRGGTVSTHLLVGAVEEVAEITSYFAESGAQLPKRRGLRAASGQELWQLDGAVVVGGRSAVTEVRPLDGSGQRFQELAETITIDRG